jgi:predicted nucleic acid-binding protein
VFEKPSQLSPRALKIIDSAFADTAVILIIPSIVFVEIFKKWFVSSERAAKIRYEVFEKIRSQDNIEIKALEREVLENFIQITDIESDHNFDNHDKQILACAMMLNCPLITSDANLIRYNQRRNVVPSIIS